MAVSRRFSQVIWCILAGSLGVGVLALNAQTPFGLRTQWTPNSEPDVVGYYIYYGPGSRVYTNRFTVLGRETTSARVEPLMPDGTYYMAITAFNSAGIESLPSIEISNSPPVISPIANQVMLEDAKDFTIYFAVSDAEHAAKDIRVSATSSDPLLIADRKLLFGGTNEQRSLLILPQLDRSGTAMITVSALDPLGASNSVTFQVSVQPVNDKPRIWLSGKLETDEDTPSGPLPFYVLDPEDPPDELWILATPSDQSLIPYENIRISGSGYQRTLSITPAPDAYGSCVIWLQVFDRQGEFESVQVEVRVRPVNDPPNLKAIESFTMSEGSPPVTVQLLGIDSGRANEAQPLVVTAVSSNPGVLPNPQVIYTSPNNFGSLAIMPAPGTNGTATVTVTVNDGQPSNGLTSRSFSVTVKPVDDPPVILGLKDSVDLRPPATSVEVLFQVRDPDTPVGELIVSGFSSDPSFLPSSNMLFAGTGELRTLTMIPTPGRTGSLTVTIVVSDRHGSVSASFHLLVAAAGG